MSYDLRNWLNDSASYPGLGFRPGVHTQAAPLGPAGGTLPVSGSPWAPQLPVGANQDQELPRPPFGRDVTTGIAVPHYDQFAGQWEAGFKKYWSRFDEALRDSWDNALAMRRDSFTEELISLRTFPVAGLPWSIVPEDPEDPEQAAIAARATKLIQAIPHYQDLKLWLLECTFYGKSATQVVWDRTTIDDSPGVTVTYWEPVSGDSIIFDWDGTPSILVRAGWQPPPGQEPAVLEQADRGRVLMLRDAFFRDRFLIMKFRRSGADFLYEGDLAGAMHGKGMRSRTYFAWLRRRNYMGWRENAAQRFPINGTLIGYYPTGNASARDETVHALKVVSQQNVVAFPKPMGSKGDDKWFERLDAPTAGYEQFGAVITEIEENIRRCWLGQELSSVAKPMGLGSSGTGDLQGDTREAYLRFDANNLDETLTTDLLNVLIRLNEWTYRGETFRGTKLPFNLKVDSLVDKKNVAERTQAITTASTIGLPLSKKQTYEDLSLTPPQDANDEVKPPAPEMGPGMGGPGGPGGPDANGEASPSLGNPGKGGVGGTKPFEAIAGPDGKPMLRRGKGMEPPAGSNGSSGAKTSPAPGKPLKFGGKSGGKFTVKSSRIG